MKRIFVAVSGLSPQILTESLYALATQDRPFIPDEVYLITTAEGADRARLLLLSDEPGWYHLLCREYGLPERAFTSERIHTMRGADGAPLHDIRTQEDNSAAADFILSVVRDLTLDEESIVHASIAGGRKTMGFYMGYAMSLFGRDQDALSHVLVSEPYESLRDFFFPSREERIIFDHSNKPLDTRLARVTMASIPFVCMRRGVPEALRSGSSSFSEVVAAASSVLVESPSLSLDITLRRLLTPLGSLELSPVDFSFYLWLARLRFAGESGVCCPPEGGPNREHGRAVLDIYREVNSFGIGGHDRTEEALLRGMEKGWFEQRKSLVNKQIRQKLGVDESPYAIVRSGNRSGFRFGLMKLAPSQIEIVS